MARWSSHTDNWDIYIYIFPLGDKSLSQITHFLPVDIKIRCDQEWVSERQLGKV